MKRMHGRFFAPGRIAGIVPLVLCLISPAAARSAPDVVDGFIQPLRTIDVAAGESGIVAKIAVKEGYRVKAGQILATLDCRALAAALELAKARLASKGRFEGAQAECRLQRQLLEGLEQLASDGHARRVELQRAQANLAVAEANLLAATEEQQLNALECRRIESLIEVRSVRSPIDGVVIKLHRQEGEFSPAHEPRLMTIVDLSTLRVDFSVSTRQAAILQVGQPLLLEVPELRTTVQGRVEYISPVTDAESGTVKITVHIDNENGRRRAGVRCLLSLRQLQEIHQSPVKEKDLL